MAARQPYRALPGALLDRLLATLACPSAQHTLSGPRLVCVRQCA